MHTSHTPSPSTQPGSPLVRRTPWLHAFLLAAGLAGLTAPAWADDMGTLLGGGAGAAAGAILGQSMGGQSGAVIGGAVGGAAGAAVSTRGSGQSGAVIGGAVGGAAGAAVGQSVGGKTGAVVGAGVGGAAGSSIGKNVTQQPRGPGATVVRSPDYRQASYHPDPGHDGGHAFKHKHKKNRGHAYGHKRHDD